MLANKKITTIAAVLTLGLAGASAADASVRNKKTRLTVNESIEIPGATLRPGKYVMKLVDSQSNRNIVRFFNENETDVISTVIAIPNRRLEPTGSTKFSFYEMPVGQAPALRAWFYPGDTFGQEFVYPKRRAQVIAKASGRYVPTLSDEMEPKIKEKPRQVSEPPPVELRTTTITAISVDNQEADTDTAAARNQESDRREPPKAPAREPLTAQEDTEEEETTTLAQARRPSPSQSSPQGSQSSRRLPDTAGPAPLLGLMGLLFLGGALGARALSKARR